MTFFLFHLFVYGTGVPGSHQYPHISKIKYSDLQRLDVAGKRAGKKKKITITNDKGRLSKEEIERMVQVRMV
jgi:hypothetical protein